jgi:hypothetical protein
MKATCLVPLNRIDRSNRLLAASNNKYSSYRGDGLGGSSSSSNSSNSSNSFGLGGLGSGLSSAVDSAKDLAKFRLGLDKEQAETSFGFRDREREGDFGRQYKLDTQSQTSQRDINRDTQESMSKRLSDELTNRLTQQKSEQDYGTATTGRAIRLASRRLGG